MVSLIFSMLAAIGFFSERYGFVFAAIYFSIAYAIILLPGAFGFGCPFDKQKLKEAIEEEWLESEKITNFIEKYWVSIEYIYSSNNRSRNCKFIGSACIGLSVWLLLAQNELWIAFETVITGIMLIVIGFRVNKVLHIINYNSLDDEWFVACASLIFASKYFKKNELDRILRSLASDESIKKALVRLSKNYSATFDSESSYSEDNVNHMIDKNEKFLSILEAFKDHIHRSVENINIGSMDRNHNDKFLAFELGCIEFFAIITFQGKANSVASESYLLDLLVFISKSVSKDTDEARLLFETWNKMINESELVFERKCGFDSINNKFNGNGSVNSGHWPGWYLREALYS
jgi:hypothetical protein